MHCGFPKAGAFEEPRAHPNVSLMVDRHKISTRVYSLKIEDEWKAMVDSPGKSRPTGSADCSELGAADDITTANYFFCLFPKNC